MSLLICEIDRTITAGFHTEITYWDYDLLYWIRLRYLSSDTAIAGFTIGSAVLSAPVGAEVMRGDALTEDQLSLLLFVDITTNTSGSALTTVGLVGLLGSITLGGAPNSSNRRLLTEADIPTINNATTGTAVIQRPDADNIIQYLSSTGVERVTLIQAGDTLALPAADNTRILRAILRPGTGTATISGTAYTQGTSAIALQWWFDGSTWQLLTGSAATTTTPTTATATSAKVTLAKLLADTWTDVPTSTTVTAPTRISVLSSAGERIGLKERLTASNVWQISASKELLNLSITLFA